MFIIVTLVANQRNDGVYTSFAIFKLFAASLNFTFNLLDIFLPVVDMKPIEEDGDDDDDGSGNEWQDEV